MSVLEQDLADYLQLRRSLGHELAEARWVLPGFVDYLDAHGLLTVTIDAALGWAQQSAPGRVTTFGPQRMTAVRGFARYLAGIHADTEVPPLGLMPYRQRWRQPFIYSPADIEALMSKARCSITSPLRAATYDTLIGLLAASGMRIGEAIKLDRNDVNWADGVLLIRESKFGKTRLVPLHSSSMATLAEHAELRDTLQPRPKEPSFFVSLTRKRLCYAVVSQTFRTLVNDTGVGVGAPSAPRLHDLRSFGDPHSARLVSDRRQRASENSVVVDLSGPSRTSLHLLVSVGRSGVARPGGGPPGHRVVGGPAMTLIAPTLQMFFTDRLAQQRQVSPRTIAAYRDTLRLLLGFVHQKTGKLPSQLDWDDLDATMISGFLNHLEDERHNTVRTRNVRLTAIRSLFSYAALRHPEHALLIQRVLAIPPKRFEKRIVTYLTPAEIDALVAAPDQSRWEGRRDRTLMLLAIQTGLRVSELIGLNCCDVTLGTGANVRCEGKGRKQRAVPLATTVQALLRSWLAERAGLPHDPLFPTRTGRRLSRDAVALRVSTHADTAAKQCPTLLGKRIHPHVLRHSCAMSLLQAGVDTSVIALWLGHAGIRSTDAYIHADISIKEKALALTTPASARPGRYHPPDKILAFLESL